MLKHALRIFLSTTLLLSGCTLKLNDSSTHHDNRNSIGSKLNQKDSSGEALSDEKVNVDLKASEILCAYTQIKGIAEVKKINKNDRSLDIIFIPGDLLFTVQANEIDINQLIIGNELKAIYEKPLDDTSKRCQTSVPTLIR